MLLTIQFPICDIRLFSQDDNSKVPNPIWPLAQTGSYIKNTGEVIRRPLGGLTSWVGEGKVCNAKRALRFPAGFKGYPSFPNLKLKIAFRRFYFDGKISGKFEIGLEVKDVGKELLLSPKELALLINEVLSTKINIPLPPNSQKNKAVYELPATLRLFYSQSTSYQQISSTAKNNLIKASQPLIFIETTKNEMVRYDFKVKNFVEFNNYGVNLNHSYFEYKKYNFRLWHMHTQQGSYSVGRELRLTLLRLNAFREGLTFLVNSLLAKKVDPSPFSEHSDELQRYFQKVAPICFELPEHFEHSELLNVIYQSESLIDSSNFNELKRLMKDRFHFRNQIYKKSVEILDKLENAQGDIVMGDKIETNVSGSNNFVAGGKNISVEGVSITNVWEENKDKIDLEKLTVEIGTLIENLKTNSTEPEHFNELSQLAKAQKESSNKNGEGALSALSKVGKWSLGIAKQVGLGVVVSAISASAGLAS